MHLDDAPSHGYDESHVRAVPQPKGLAGGQGLQVVKSKPRLPESTSMISQISRVPQGVAPMIFALNGSLPASNCGC